MKKFIPSFKALTTLFIAVFVLLCAAVFAQGDTTATDGSAVISILPSLPVWLQTVLAIAAIVLPALQAVLKLIPTHHSIRISGWIGKILDLATFFVKDKRAGGGKFK